MENKSVQVSVIVPVYNVAAYLERCVKSLLAQTFPNLEILLIDDGSKDASGAMCDRFAAEYDRVRVVHKENGGLGSARNCGISNATGEYLCFVDSDDTVYPDYVKCLYEAIVQNQAQLSVCGYEYVSGEYVSPVMPKTETVDIQTMLKRFSRGEAVFNFAWNKLYKREYILKQPQLYADRHCAEDMYFNCFYYRHVEKVAVVSQPLYTYFVNMGSLSNGRRPGFWEDMLLIDSAFRETCAQKGLEKQNADTLLMVMLRNAVSNYYNTEKVTCAEGKAYVASCTDRLNQETFQPDRNALGKVDRLLSSFIENKQYFLVHLSMKGIKFVKKNMFGLFCKLRGN